MNAVAASVNAVAIVVVSAIAVEALAIAPVIAVEILAIVAVILAIALVIAVEILVIVAQIFRLIKSGIVAETSVSVSGTLLVTLVDQCGGINNSQLAPWSKTNKR